MAFAKMINKKRPAPHERKGNGFTKKVLTEKIKGSVLAILPIRAHSGAAFHDRAVARRDAGDDADRHGENLGISSICSVGPVILAWACSIIRPTRSIFPRRLPGSPARPAWPGFFMESRLDILPPRRYTENGKQALHIGRGESVKNRLEEIRKQRGVKQEELAAALEVSRQTIGSLENGRYNPSITLAFKIARYFGMGIEEIFIYEEESS